MKLILLFIFSVPLLLNAQKKVEKLSYGERIPFSRVDVFNSENKKTNLDLPNKNSLSEKYVAVFIYSLKSTPVKELIAFNNDIERVLNKYQNNACKGASEIEYATICLEKEYSKWIEFLDQTKSKSKFTGKKTNYLASGKMEDAVLKAFKVTENPVVFLVNPVGRLRGETNDADMLEVEFLNICKSNSSNATADISGKLLYGEKNKMPLTEHKVYLVKSNADTIKTTSTDSYGDFTFKQIDTTQNLSVRVQETEKTKSETRIYLAKQTGEIVKEFRRNRFGGFEYRLLQVDIVKLTEIEDDDDITIKYKKFNTTGQKDLTVTENIYYESAKYAILTESEIVLDKVLVILNANPETILQVISHTDAQGDNAKNMTLSIKRSEAVINYLISKGVSATRLKPVGKGETEIRNRCVDGELCSDKEHEYNRRTEFKFIKK